MMKVGSVEAKQKIREFGGLLWTDCDKGRLEDGEKGPAPPRIDIQSFDNVVTIDFDNFARLCIWLDPEGGNFMQIERLPVSA